MFLSHVLDDKNFFGLSIVDCSYQALKVIFTELPLSSYLFLSSSTHHCDYLVLMVVGLPVKIDSDFAWNVSQLSYTFTK